MVILLILSILPLTLSCKISCYPNCPQDSNCELKCECLDSMNPTQAFSVDIENKKIKVANITDDDIQRFEEEMGCPFYCVEDCNKNRTLFDCFNICGCRSFLTPSPKTNPTTPQNTTVETHAAVNLNADQAIKEDCKNLCTELCLNTNEKSCMTQCYQKFCVEPKIMINQVNWSMTSQLSFCSVIIGGVIMLWRQTQSTKRNEIFNGYTKL